MYVTAKEVRNSILDNKDRFEDENDVTIDISNDSEPDFNDLEGDEFDLILSTNYDTINGNIDID